MLVCGDARVSERAREDGVEILREHGERAGRKTDAFAQVFVRAPVEVLKLKRNAVRLSDVLKHVNCFAYDFGADAVARDDGDAFLGFRHFRSVMRLLN